MSNFKTLLGLTATLQARILGDEPGALYFGDDAVGVPVNALIDRDVEVVASNGLTTEKRTVASIEKSKIGFAKKNHRLQVGQKSYYVNDIISDDGYFIEVYLRG